MADMARPRDRPPARRHRGRGGAWGPSRRCVAVTALNQARPRQPSSHAVAAAGLARGIRRPEDRGPPRRRRIAGRRPSEAVDQRASPGCVPAPVASARRRPVARAAVAPCMVGARRGSARRRPGGRHSSMPASSSFAAEWVEPLLGPRSAGMPTTSRPSTPSAVTEGTLTTNLLAPLVRSLFGKRLCRRCSAGAAPCRRIPPRCPPAGGGLGRRADRARAPRRDSSARPRPVDHALVEVSSGPEAARSRRGARRSRSHPCRPPSGRSSGSWSATSATGRTCGSAARPAGADRRPPRRWRPTTSGPTGWCGPSTSA